MATAENKWIRLGVRGAGTEEVYYRKRHIPCGTEVEFFQGYCGPYVCPKCQPEEWAAQKKEEGL